MQITEFEPLSHHRKLPNLGLHRMRDTKRLFGGPVRGAAVAVAVAAVTVPGGRVPGLGGPVAVVLARVPGRARVAFFAHRVFGVVVGRDLS